MKYFWKKNRLDLNMLVLKDSNVLYHDSICVYYYVVFKSEKCFLKGYTW